MNKNILSKEEVNMVLGMARYWNEVNKRDEGGSTNITEVLWSELKMVVQKLGLKTLWILEEYAKESKEKEVKNEQYKCQSYVEGGIVKDCSCGKCY